MNSSNSFGFMFRVFNPFTHESVLCKNEEEVVAQLLLFPDHLYRGFAITLFPTIEGRRVAKLHKKFDDLDEALNEIVRLEASGEAYGDCPRTSAEGKSLNKRTIYSFDVHLYRYPSKEQAVEIRKELVSKRSSRIKELFS